MSICYIDIVDACQLRCPTCARGVRLMPNSNKQMPLYLFKNIIGKAKSEGYDTIGTYNWTEPFLTDNFPEYISAIKEIGLGCQVSSNLSFTNRLDVIERAFAAGMDELIVSVSGFNQEVYEINHKGGDIAYVKSNLAFIRQIFDRSLYNATVTIKFLKFHYNDQEQIQLSNYAKNLRFNFEIFDGVGRPDMPVADSEETFLNRMRNYSPVRQYEDIGFICPLIMDTISIDSDGYTYLCCAYPNYNALRIGSYMELSQNEIVLSRYMHALCNSCSFPRRKVNISDFNAISDALKLRFGIPASEKYYIPIDKTWKSATNNSLINVVRKVITSVLSR